MKNKGFTLLELLGVIMLVAIIGLITLPLSISYIEKSRTSSYRISVQNVMEAAKQYVTKYEENNDFPIEGIDITKVDLGLKEKNKFQHGMIIKNTEGEIEVEDVYNGSYCANGTKQNIVVEKASSIDDCDKIDAKAPTLRVKAVSVTSNKIIVSAIARAKSGIKEYEYCIGNDCYTEKINSHEFKDLKAGETYEIKVTVRNNNYGNDDQYPEEITTKTEIIEVTTPIIEAPTLKISSSSYQSSKEVVIKYGKKKEGMTYGYVLR